MSVDTVDDGGVVADLQRPDGAPRGVAVLAHGAGGTRTSPILRAYADELTDRGFVVARIDLPYRQRRPKGPPAPSTAAADRDGIRMACTMFRTEAPGALVVGGHSYGGRQTSMLLAEHPDLADAVLLSSYPLHPPGKPDRLRIDHLPSLRTPTVVVHGSTDPFATAAELADAVALIDAPTRVVEIERAGHDLRPDRRPVARLAADALDDLLAGVR